MSLSGSFKNGSNVVRGTNVCNNFLKSQSSVKWSQFLQLLRMFWTLKISTKYTEHFNTKNIYHTINFKNTSNVVTMHHCVSNVLIKMGNPEISK